MAIEWTDAFCIGVQVVDEQHRTLVDQINQLMTAMQASQGKDAIERLLSFLNDYVVEHFETEEALMLRHAYPGYEAHRSLHQEFIRTLGDLKKDFARTGPTSALAISVNAKVGSWLIQHVLSTDQALGRYLAQQKAS